MATLKIPARYLEDFRSVLAAELENDTGLFDQVLLATGETTIENDHEEVSYVLAEMVCVLARRLDGIDRLPTDMGAVLDIAGELRWVAEQAIQIDPRLDQRKAA
jgi:hypothetical protein